MRSDDLSPLLLAAGATGDVGYRQGTVIDWDPDTGDNTIDVAGAKLTDLPVLSASAITLAPGDVVGILRTRTSWMILGSITTASLRIRAAHTDSTHHSVAADMEWHSLPDGPSVTATIGNSRQCVVLMAMATNATDCQIGCGVAVSGASTIDPLNTASAAAGLFGASGAVFSGSVSSFQVFTDEDELHPGSNTFTLQYKAGGGSSGSSSHIFWDRRITVIPL